MVFFASFDLVFRPQLHLTTTVTMAPTSYLLAMSKPASMCELSQMTSQSIMRHLRFLLCYRIPLILSPILVSFKLSLLMMMVRSLDEYVCRVSYRGGTGIPPPPPKSSFPLQEMNSEAKSAPNLTLYTHSFPLPPKLKTLYETLVCTSLSEQWSLSTRDNLGPILSPL